MKKVKFRHILFSLIFSAALSFGLSFPILHNIRLQSLQTTQTDVEKIYSELNHALMNADLVSLQKLLADGFELHTIYGNTLSKQEWIRNMQLGRMRYNQISQTEVKAIGLNSAAVSAVLVGEIWDNKETWQLRFHLEIIRKGQNVQIQRMVSKSVCEAGADGIFNKNCLGAKKRGD